MKLVVDNSRQIDQEIADVNATLNEMFDDGCTEEILSEIKAIRVRNPGLPFQTVCAAARLPSVGTSRNFYQRLLDRCRAYETDMSTSK